MKVRLTVMTENDIPADHVLNVISKEEAESKAMAGWNVILEKFCLLSENGDRAYVEKCEFLGD